MDFLKLTVTHPMHVCVCVYHLFYYTNAFIELTSFTQQHRVLVNIHGHIHHGYGEAHAGMISVLNPGPLM